MINVKQKMVKSMIDKSPWKLQREGEGKGKGRGKGREGERDGRQIALEIVITLWTIANCSSFCGGTWSESRKRQNRNTANSDPSKITGILDMKLT